jgi:hypothetical protein
MVAQLLREFFAGPWLDDLDLDGMERLNAKFHADTSERRDRDMISDDDFLANPRRCLIPSSDSSGK